jgi:hypothetical protein
MKKQKQQQGDDEAAMVSSSSSSSKRRKVADGLDAGLDVVAAAAKEEEEEECIANEEEEEGCAYGLLRGQQFLPMLQGHANLLRPKAGLARLRTMLARPGWVRRATDGAEERAAVHYKYAPMLDPQYYLLGRYDVAERAELPSRAYRAYVTRHQKIMDPMNSAAMDALGAYLSGELFRQGLPTALESFGYRVGLKQRFRFDVGVECMYLCHEWDTPENAHRFAWCSRPADYEERRARMLLVRGDADDGEEEEEASTTSSASSSTSSSSSSTGGGGGGTNDDENEDEDDGCSEDDWAYPPGEATVDLFNVPVVMVAMEQCTGGTLEDLLAARRAAGAPLSEPESASLILQLMFTLAAFQRHYGFVHGDLHMRNVLWTPTDRATLPFVFEGAVYEVPSHGRIFKLVDFGRSAFEVDGRAFLSDAFMPYGDGSGMLNCGAGEDRGLRRVAPSRSLDLGLLSGPLFEALAGDAVLDAMGVAFDEGGAAAARAAFERTTTPTQKHVFSWGVMRVGDDESSTAAAATTTEDGADCCCDDTEDDEDEAYARSLETFDPDWAGKHSTICTDGTQRFDRADIFRINQVVARFVRDAEPAPLLRRCLRPATGDWSFE